MNRLNRWVLSRENITERNLTKKLCKTTQTKFNYKRQIHLHLKLKRLSFKIVLRPQRWHLLDSDLSRWLAILSISLKTSRGSLTQCLSGKCSTLKPIWVQLTQVWSLPSQSKICSNSWVCSKKLQIKKVVTKRLTQPSFCTKRCLPNSWCIWLSISSLLVIPSFSNSNILWSMEWN